MLAFELLAAFALVAANGFFVATEFAIARIRLTQVDDLEAAGRPGAGALRHAVEHIDAYLAACQLGITLASLGLGMYGEHAVAVWFMQAFTWMGYGSWVAAHSASTALAVGILTYLHIVVGEMVPKSLALQRPEHTGYRIVGPMKVFGTIIAPAVLGLNTLGNGLLRLVGVDRRRPSEDRYYTPEELQVVVRESGAHGTIPPSAARVKRSRPNWSVPNGCAHDGLRRQRAEVPRLTGEVEQEHRDLHAADPVHQGVVQLADQRGPAVGKSVHQSDLPQRSGAVELRRRWVIGVPRGATMSRPS